MNPKPQPIRLRFSPLVWVLLAILSFSGRAAGVTEPPEQLVRETTEQMVVILRTERDQLETTPGRLYSLIGERVLPHFDFNRISRWVLGRYWRAASQEQQARFQAEFRTMLVRSYASALFDYVDQEITYLPMRGDSSGREAIVRTVVSPAGGLPIPVDYRLHRSGDTWKVFDVRIDGISLVANYRTSFGRQVSRQGIDGLIESLSRKNQAQAGAP